MANNAPTPVYDVSKDGQVVTRHFVDVTGKMVGFPVTFTPTTVDSQLVELNKIKAMFTVQPTPAP